jgi:hypothetical protein
MRRNFLLMGQSNMSGRGLVSQAPAYENIARMFMYGNDGAWKQAAEPLDSPTGQKDKCSNDGNSAGVGPGMAFANRICTLYPNDEVGLIPCAKGSTFIKQWRRLIRINASGERLHLYASALYRAMEAEEEGVLSGILWWQGEAESTVLAEANLWVERFITLMNDLRGDLGKPDLPIAYARLNNIKQTTKHPYWATMRRYQENVPLHKSVMVSTDDLPFQADKIHATTADQQVIGVRFADAIATLL